MADLYNIGIGFDFGQAVPSAERAAQALDKVGATAERTADRAKKGARTAADSIDEWNKSVERLLVAMGGLEGLRTLQRYIDEYTRINNLLGAVSRSQREFAAASAAVYDIAQKTRSALDATATLYARLEQATQSLGVSQKDMLRVTQTINEALVIGGGAAGENKRAVLDLAHAFGRATERDVVASPPRLTMPIPDAGASPAAACRACTSVSATPARVSVTRAGESVTRANISVTRAFVSVARAFV